MLTLNRIAWFPINPVVGIFASVSFAMIARKFFKKEQEGKPIEYSETFQTTLSKVPGMKHVSPVLENLETTRKSYRD